MKDYHYAAIASISIHTLLLSLLLALSPVESRQVRTIEVDFALVQGQSVLSAGPEAATQASGGRPRGHGSGPARKARGSAAGHAGGQRDVVPNHPAAGGNAERTQSSEPPAADVGTALPRTTDPIVYPAAAHDADYAAANAYVSAGGYGDGLHHGGYGTGIGGGGGTGEGSGVGTGAGGGDGEGLAAGGRDYRYIRDAVMQNVRYPEEAIRLGIEGSVLVSFKVLENGWTSEVKVVRASGSRLLDRSAKEAVARTRVGRKVPYRVVVHLPITYRLRT